MIFLYYKELLEIKKKEILASWLGEVRLIRENELVDGCPLDEGEKSEINHRIVVNMQILMEKARLLKTIDMALQRIDKGEFGNCVDCGEPISVSRLEAVPYVSRCASCQEKSEAELIPLKTDLNI